MTKGFYCDGVGYWETNSDPDQATIDAYPAGTIEVPLRPGPGHSWNIGSWVAAQPQPQSADVDAERDRRILAGGTFDVAGYGAVRIIGREVDMRNLTNLALAAQARIAAGAGSAVTNFRDADNVIHPLVQAQVLDLWSKGAALVEAIYAASWAIKDGGAIPADYADDSRWP